MTSIRECIVVESNGVEWRPPVKKVNGNMFAPFAKFDSCLTRLITGKPYNRSSRRNKPLNDLNVAFVDTMLRLRQEACDAAVIKAHTDGDEDVPKATKRQRRAKASDAAIAPAVVTPVFDEYIGPDIVLDPCTIDVLFGTGYSTLWINLTEENLEYIKARVACDQSRGRTRRSRSSHADEEVQSNENHDTEQQDGAEGDEVEGGHSQDEQHAGGGDQGADDECTQNEQHGGSASDQ